MNQNLAQQIYALDNDYSHLEATHHLATGGELVRDPYRSIHHPVPELTLSVSVVVAAQNERATSEKRLISIEQSSFNS